MPRRLRVFSASMSWRMLSLCSTVCMNCLAWLRLNNSREALASPISRMPRFLFQSVFERVRVGIDRAISRPLNADVETLSARPTILDIVTLSRSLFLVPAVDFSFAMDLCLLNQNSVSSSSPRFLAFAFLLFANDTGLSSSDGADAVADV